MELPIAPEPNSHLNEKPPVFAIAFAGLRLNIEVSVTFSIGSYCQKIGIMNDTRMITTKGGNIEAPIVGRICMDQCMVDITGTEAGIGDVVTLFGDDPKRLYRLAELAGTIDYECLCLISGRVPRIYK